MPSSLNVVQRASRMARSAREAVNRVFHKKKPTPVDGEYSPVKTADIYFLVPQAQRVNARSRMLTERRPRRDVGLGSHLPAVVVNADICASSEPIVPREGERDWCMLEDLAKRFAALTISDEVKAASQPASVVRFVEATTPLRASSNVIPKKTPQSRLQRKPRVSRRPLQHEPTPQVTGLVPAPINTNVSPRPTRPLPARKGRKGVTASVSSSPIANIPALVISGPLPPTRPLPICKVRQVVSVSTALSRLGFPPPVFAQKNDLLENLFPGKKITCEEDSMEDLWVELFGPDPDVL